MIKKILFLLFLLLPLTNLHSQPVTFRPPSVPLVAHDPYFSIWSPADRLWDAETVHWTGKRQALHSIVRIDGKPYRLMGSRPSTIEPVPQTGLTVYPTQTVYQFKNHLVSITLTFTAPALPDNLDLLSRPVTYITWKIAPADGRQHEIQLYFDCSAEVAVDHADQQVRFNRAEIPGLSALSVGSVDQPVLEKRGDDLRIDWGYAYLAIPASQKPVIVSATGDQIRKNFTNTGNLKPDTLNLKALPVKDGFPVMAAVWDLGRVGNESSTRWAMLAYDDLYSIRYLTGDLLPYWKRDGATIQQVLQKASSEYPEHIDACIQFDQTLIEKLVKAGGEKYALTGSLAYRECLAAHKIAADEKGNPLVFAKENFSNGCIATVDVIYPASPFFFCFSLPLTRAMLKPILDYSSSSRWKFDFAPHDLGTYPHATGQVYGGGEKTEENQMPVEETGNMLILMAMLSKAEGNASFAASYWPLMEKWARYLLTKGFDPENQLCTDDFAGHLAHNINLSAKAIVALAAYSELCILTGRSEEAKKYRTQAESFVKDWIKLATEGDHTRLAFDQPGTWSQKYNLVWDKLLGLNLFPKEVVRKEIDFYKTIQAPYGLPLDNRERWTKTDWILWTATLADNPEDFAALFNPVFDFINATPQRVPITDWYVVDNAYRVGFQARPVIGGLFIKLLAKK